MPSKPSENVIKLIELVQSNTDNYVVLATHCSSNNSKWLLSLKTKDETKDISRYLFVTCGQKEYSKPQAEKDYRALKGLTYRNKLKQQRKERQNIWGSTDVLLSKMREKTAQYRNLIISMPWYANMHQSVRWDSKIR